LTRGGPPRQFGIVQDVTIDFDWTDKELWGQNQFPVAIARGQGKITGKSPLRRSWGSPLSTCSRGRPHRNYRPALLRLRSGLLN
jgi:hypothetical protein